MSGESNARHFFYLTISAETCYTIKPGFEKQQIFFDVVVQFFVFGVLRENDQF
jgi:hypothetical protein